MNHPFSAARSCNYRFRLSCFLSLVLATGSAFATDPIYVNFGSVTTPPQIDASNFVNYGTFDLFTSLPLETSSTLNYTNYGNLICTPGWFFDTAPFGNPAGVRHTANSFVNYPNGVVQAQDAAGAIILGAPTSSSVSPSHLWVEATNIVNHGL